MSQSITIMEEVVTNNIRYLFQNVQMKFRLISFIFLSRVDI